MNSVSVSRTLDAQPTTVREAMDNLEQFMKAAGFDEVMVEDDTIQISKQVGLLTIELLLELGDDPDVGLTYEQREGIFEEMVTRYTVTETAEGSEVEATTEFAIDVAVVGDILDSTVIKRQRRKELTAQFDWLEQNLDDEAKN